MTVASQVKLGASLYKQLMNVEYNYIHPKSLHKITASRDVAYECKDFYSY